jgi:hypothetical protein
VKSLEGRLECEIQGIVDGMICRMYRGEGSYRYRSGKEMEQRIDI